MAEQGESRGEASSGVTEDSLLGEIARAPDSSPRTPLRWHGEVLADRFEIGRLAGAGGMGAVYQALDRLTGTLVALKLATEGATEHERFAQEARTLSKLAHPAIVRYVAHGITAQGQPFLAMEWLEGEDLAQRFKRARLSEAESLATVRAVAEGLAAAHARGVVHRDVKPSNIFLVGGDPWQAKLIDFGIVRLGSSGLATTTRPLTRAGVLLGTVGYMSPEQATGDPGLDARADVFALGCVLFECLTGDAAFSGEHVVAVLAKVLREEAPRLRQRRPDLPAQLDNLVARMLSKEKAGRPADGAAVLEELLAIERASSAVPASGPPTEVLSTGERRLLVVMLAIVPDAPERLRDVVERHGGNLARLANGTLLITLSSRGATSEQVVVAAGCALELSETFPGARIALATGRAQTNASAPTGPVIDKAASLLAGSTFPGIRIDEVTLGLLGERFDVRQQGAEQLLSGRRSDIEAPRTLLGKVTPCIGRDKERALLEATLHECVDESVARAVLVTGPPGQGKSRLRYELVAAARKRGDVVILTARADPVGAGSAFMLVRQLIRQATGLRSGDRSGERHAKLRAHVASICEKEHSDRIADFLGELIDVPAVEHATPQLRAARNDPQIMAGWLRRSFAEWLSAECSTRPLLVVLEDLHWGDLPSVTYLDAGLRGLATKPFMLLALARPEVHDTFPNLWAGAAKIEVPLDRLTPRAAERLVRAALGDKIAPDTVGRIVQRSNGNAFYLEELIRCVAEGSSDALPETVLALAESRLERLEPNARRIVRAASVFGEVFWKGGVAALLGASEDSQDLDAWLRALTEREVVSVAPHSRFASEHEYVFRHDLLREAAYAMLTADDRTRGHGLAGEWLERAGERDALPLADHFEQSADPKRAIPWLRRAAQSAFEGNNMAAATTLADRGLACAPVEYERAALTLARLESLGLGGQWKQAVERAREAMQLCAEGSVLWFRAAADLLIAATLLGDTRVMAPTIQQILGVSVQPEPSGPYGLAIYCASTALCRVGKLELARAMLERTQAIGDAMIEPDLVFTAWLHASRGYLALVEGEVGRALAVLAQARALCERAGYMFGQAVATHHSLQATVQTGNGERTEAFAREVIALCAPVGLSYLTDYALYARARLALTENRVTEAIASFRSLLDRQDLTMVSRAHAWLAHALIANDDQDAAEREAATAMEKGALFPDARAIALSALARLALLRGRPADALDFSDRGLAAEAYASEASVLRLTRAEALHALGRTGDACVAIAEGRDRILAMADSLDDPELRASFLRTISANARTLQLANEWLGEA